MTCWAKMGEKQAAPGNGPAFGCSIGLSGRDTGVKTSRWVILGSRLLSCFPLATSDRTGSRQVSGVRFKAAPLQQMRRPNPSWLLYSDSWLLLNYSNSLNSSNSHIN
jgi:hypothetical protein